MSEGETRLKAVAIASSRISERFNDVVRSLFAAHKKDALDDEQNEILTEMKDLVHLYLDEKDRDAGRAKVTVLAKQLGLSVSNLTDEEILVMTKVMERSPRFKRAAKNIRKRKKIAAISGSFRLDMVGHFHKICPAGGRGASLILAGCIYKSAPASSAHTGFIYSLREVYDPL
ncbi:hypothetical protein LJC60_03975 [Ruminococcaceae bacterium OttesenSCG-928-D13]|nr:hypothetical protein [Ruminococcaceae bacterium OttesenSCG-928-D13]